MTGTDDAFPTTGDVAPADPAPVRAGGGRRSLPGPLGGPWVRFLLRRAVRAVVALLVITTAAFLVMHLAGGDPVRSALGPTAPEATVAARRAELGLDRPLSVQYLSALTGLLHGDLGASLITGRSVSDLLAGRLPATLELSLISFVVVLLVSVPLGLATAVLTRAGRARGAELAFTGTTGVLAAVPEYLLGVTLVVVFAVTFDVLPVTADGTPASYVMPVLSLSLPAVAGLSRIARVEALAVLDDDYVRTARAKHMGLLRVHLVHVLPNMLTAVLTLGGTTLSTMVVGSLLVEQVFNWPGLGTAFTTAITSKDYGVVQGLALVYASMVLLVTFLVDVVVATVDRRTTLLETA